MTEPETLPVPPLRLRRIHLRGIGPDAARFDPLNLDFAADGGAASRVLLSLTNTGGKSTLITMVSSLVVPAARSQVGKKNLGDYVLTGDTSHIVTEWEDATVGVRTVLGTVMEWKDGRRQPGEKSRSTTGMYRSWYMFRTGDGLPGIDDLPFLNGDKRTGFKQFMSESAMKLSDLPEARWLATDKQTEWAQALVDNTGIDPVLFGYQMRMNDEETGADALLQNFNSSDNVVRFLITALNDDRALVDFTKKLTEYAEVAGQRPVLEVQAAFADAVAPLVDELAGLARAVESSTGEYNRRLLAGGRFATSINNRIDQDRDRLCDFKQTADEAKDRLSATSREQNRVSDIRLQLQLDEARHRKQLLADKVDGCERQASHLRNLQAAWNAVEALLDFDEAKATLQAAKAAYDSAQTGLTPLRSKVDASCSQLAARLDSLIDDTNDQAEAADTTAAEAQAASKAAAKAREAAALRSSEKQRELADIDEATDEAERRRREAETAKLIEPAELGKACVRRWTSRADEAERRSKEDAVAAQQAEAHFDSLVLELRSHTDELDRLRQTAAEHARRLDEFTTGLRTLADNDTIKALLDGEPRDVTEVGRAGDLAEAAALRKDERANTAQAMADEAQAELDYLDRCGTSPAGVDVLRVLDILQEQRIGAVTGLQWINGNIQVPEQRPGFIAARSDIASGVVVTDPASFDRAVAVVTDAAPRTQAPVTVLSFADHPDDTNATSALSHVVIPHRATWDGDWAVNHATELAKTVRTQSEDARASRTSAQAHRQAATACSHFADKWSDADYATLVSRRDVTAAAESEAESKRLELEEQRDGHRDHARALRERAGTFAAEAAIARRNSDQAEALTVFLSKAEEAESHRGEVELAMENAEKARSRADAEQTDADQRNKAAVGHAAQCRADRGRYRDERSTLGGIDAGTDTGEPLETLRARWLELREVLKSREAGMQEAGNLDEANRRLGLVRNRWNAHGKNVQELARELSRIPAGSSPEARVAARAENQNAVDTAEKELGMARAQYEVTSQQVTKLTPPADRKVYFDLNNATRWQPKHPEEIPELLESLVGYNAELLAKRDRQAEEAQEAEKRYSSVSEDVEALSDIVTLWIAGNQPTEQVFDAGKSEARSRLRALIAELNTAEGAKKQAEKERADCLRQLRAAAHDARWRDAPDAAMIRIRDLDDADLIDEAPRLAHQLRTLGASAHGDLDKMDVNRGALRDGLIHRCRDQRRLLREMVNASRLPAGLGEPSGQPAIRIDFDAVSDHEAAGLLADRIDRWAIELAENPKKVNSPELRARWLADAVRDTVTNRMRSGHWTIKILKPTIDGQVKYCAPDRIPHEFSGGQVLTLAVLVYCALSGVRSRHRPGGRRPAGALILDNPFGSASQETLIKMQHRLAAHTGLQLVCATGLNEPAVESAFASPGSVIVKLRNDGDMRRNLRFLNLRATVVDGVDIPVALSGGREAAAAQNWVDAISYEARQ